MSWDLDVAEAGELAKEYLAAMRPPGNDAWVITAVEERDWGWTVSWNNKRAAEGSSGTYANAGLGNPEVSGRAAGQAGFISQARPATAFTVSPAGREGAGRTSRCPGRP